MPRARSASSGAIRNSNVYIVIVLVIGVDGSDRILEYFTFGFYLNLNLWSFGILSFKGFIC